MEGDGRGERDERRNVLRVRGRVDRGERAAEAITEDVDALVGRAARSFADRTAEVAIADVVEGEQPVFAAGLAPVDDEDVVPLCDEVFDETFSRLQVEDVVAVDERRHEEHRRRVREALGTRGVAQQLPLVLAEDDLVRRLRELRAPRRHCEEVPAALHRLQRLGDGASETVDERSGVHA